MNQPRALTWLQAHKPLASEMTKPDVERMAVIEQDGVARVAEISNCGKGEATRNSPVQDDRKQREAQVPLEVAPRLRNKHRGVRYEKTQ